MRRLITSLLFIYLLAISQVALPQVKITGTGKATGTVKVSVTAGGGGGSDFATDTFTESSDVTLASHTPNLGGPWVAHSDTGSYPSTATVDAATDRVYPVNVSCYWITATPPSADYYVQATFTARSIMSGNVSVAGRMDTSANTMYILRLNNGTSYELRSIVTGTQTTLCSGAATTTNQIPNAGDSRTLKLVMTGNQISGYIQGVLELGPCTDSSITTAGKAGLRFSGAFSSTTGYHFDDFSAR